MRSPDVHLLNLPESLWSASQWLTTRVCGPWYKSLLVTEAHFIPPDEQSRWAWVSERLKLIFCMNSLNSLNFLKYLILKYLLNCLYYLLCDIISTLLAHLNFWTNFCSAQWILLPTHMYNYYARGKCTFMRPIFLVDNTSMNVVLYIWPEISEGRMKNKKPMNNEWKQEQWKMISCMICVRSEPSIMKFYHRKYMLTKKNIFGRFFRKWKNTTGEIE